MTHRGGYGLSRHQGPRAAAFHRWALALLAAAGGASPIHAQTDYYNTDAGRPVLIEDAYPVERFAFELQLAPVRLERLRGGVYSWGFEPELAHGILPRTQLELGFPIHIVDAPTALKEKGLAGIEVSALHNLNVETATLPALAVAAEVVLPVGSRAPDDAYLSAKAIATRTFRAARFHLNGRYTFGPAPIVALEPTPPTAGDGSTAREPSGEISRWMAGVAVDRTFPLRSALVTGALYAQQPLDDAADLEWAAEAGLRYQWSPTLAIDAGLGRRLTGEAPSWSLTFGAAYVFAVRSLMPR